LIENFFSPSVNDKNKFMRITGSAGVGKSSLALSTINYVQDRNFMGGGIIYINCENIQDFKSFLKLLINRIEKDSSNWVRSAFDDLAEDLLLTTSFLKDTKQLKENHFDRLFQMLLQSGERFLFFFDNVDLLLKIQGR